MLSISLSLQLLTVSTIILQKTSIHRLNSVRHSIEQSYDFIVVGSGSAGAIVAHRLAESRHVRVLLLEAGPSNGVPNDIPAEYSLLLNSEYDWNYTQANQNIGLAYKAIPENRGYGLGGSSSINAMIFNRGHRKTFDEWAQEYGAIGWTYEEVLPYFKKYENNTDPKIVSNGYHGTSGPIEITSWPEPVDPIIVIHQQALREMGFTTTDINGPQQTGTAIAQAFISKSGLRSSTANAYLDPNPFPNNLHIMTGALVTKILFNRKTAIGVEFVREGKLSSVGARREVIVSAGTINSPQLLMLSGIGPRKQLESFGIPVLSDLPVGENLQNHPSVNVEFLIKAEHKNLVKSGDPELTINKLFTYYTQNRGDLALNYNPLIYFSTKFNNDNDFPNACIEFPVRKYPKKVNEDLFGANRRQQWRQYFDEYRETYDFFAQAILERIRSFGFVRLQSNSAFVHPIINPKMLSNSQDMEDIIEITKFMFYFFERSSFAPYVEPHKPIPGCQFCPGQRFVYKCDSYIRCLTRQLAFNGYHSVGTCRMGAVNRRDTVLDPRLRVKGLRGVRVCDASIMPTITNGNTNAPSLMIGEKCADLVKEDNHFRA